MIGCLVLAVIAAVIYLLMGVNIISIPELGTEEAPAAIVYIAAGCYLIGGLLILLRKRWLWVIGLAANTLVIFIFLVAYNQRPEIMFSLPGLGTKVAQILLEIGLVYLIATYRGKTQLAHTSL